MKKNYNQPMTRTINAGLEQIMAGLSGADNSSLNGLLRGKESVKVSDNSFNGEFGAKGIRYWEL
ncbi:MAG: hypothetical protein IJL54_04910 [Prevotella sp.]|nr:hypothetical protein [Prevotella sp.]